MPLLKPLAFAAALCLPTPGQTDSLDFVFERCVLPQLEGRNLPTDGLLEITPQEAGGTFEPGDPVPEFFRDDAGYTLGRVFLFTMRACTVRDMKADDIDVIISQFLSRGDEVGLVTEPACRHVNEEGRLTVVAAHPQRTERGRFVTVAIGQNDKPGEYEVYAFETPTTNVPLDCSWN